IIATTIGTIMGGPLGIGTIVLAITIGPLIQGVCHIADLNLKAIKQLNIIEFYRLLRAEES
ncbi:MAG: membrane protein, partial [Tissierellia bacterium]|nr:membrane protein [Tissierellia bacterium]